MLRLGHHLSFQRHAARQSSERIVRGHRTAEHPRSFRGAGAGQCKAASNPAYRLRKAHVDFGLGEFPWDRLKNLHGGSLAIGHPFAATGARILSQAAKELGAMAAGSRAVVSVCADGGHGKVALLERV